MKAAEDHNSRISVLFMITGILFCVCLITANLLEVKVVKMGALTVTAGLTLFPVSYILNDCISEVWGFRKARLLIWLAFGINFLVMLIFRMAVGLPSPDFWEHGSEFDFVFGFAPRIVAASLVAFLTGSMVNALVMSKMKRAHNGRHFSLRAVASTLAGECLDSLVFFPIAFSGTMPFRELAKMMLVQACLKTLYEIVILPVTVLTVRWMKKREGCDVIDGQISYNPFRINDF